MKMNFKRQMLNELDRLVGRGGAARFVIRAFDHGGANEVDDYFGWHAREYSERTGDGSALRACWEYFVEAFKGDNVAMWSYLRSMDNDEVLVILLGAVFENNSEQALVFLRTVMDEEAVRRFIESDEEGGMIQEYGIEYHEPNT